jgi:hypothetical protein
MDIYNRQQELDLHIPDKVAVLGCGGIGSWIALNLALVGVKHLILVDPDIIEDTNLNRTPFCYTQIGWPKVDALEFLIKERREDCVVETYQMRDNEIDKEFEDLKYIVNCKDKSFADINIKTTCEDPVIVKCGYDGFQYTISVNPHKQFIFSLGDGDQGYRTIPSWLVTPQYIASIVTGLLTAFPYEKLRSTKYTYSADIRETISQTTRVPFEKEEIDEDQE